MEEYRRNPGGGAETGEGEWVGRYDMSGNVWECCFDGGIIEDTLTYRVYRGGSWSEGAVWMAIGLKGENNPEYILPGWVWGLPEWRRQKTPSILLYIVSSFSRGFW